MNAEKNHYKVTNRDWHDSLPQTFATFEEAFDAQQKWDEDAVIECITSDSVEVVWTPDYENFASQDAFWLNNCTPIEGVSGLVLVK